jgi:hypothetical protein
VIEGGTVVSSATEDPPAVHRSRRSKVVVSEAYGGPRSAWRATDPDATAARTRISGAMDDETVQK